MTDIIPLFARNLSAIDNSELIEAKKFVYQFLIIFKFYCSNGCRYSNVI